MELTERRVLQLLQTATVNFKEGNYQTPASYDDDEKQYYEELMKQMIADKKAGRTVNYSIPCSYD